MISDEIKDLSRALAQARFPAASDACITAVIEDMASAHSRITSQGQVSSPAEVRRKPGAGPESVIEWDEEQDRIVVRRSARFTSDDIHRAVFPDGPPKPRTLEEPEEGIRKYVRERHARR
jgi:bifunctional DNA-binding transcriptional regulator/antitoxin component of YhaV-PrlF toxin-antitoxin module